MSGDIDRKPAHSSDTSSETEGLLRPPKKPCRSCVDFQTWMKDKSKASVQQPKLPQKSGVEEGTVADIPRHDCPLDINELGQSTWGFLHTMAASYPEKPTSEDQTRVKSFMSTFSYLYPCEMCAYDFRRRLVKTPVEANSQRDLSQWMCRMHNQINSMLGKKTFDCSRVNERWKDGWDDGSCG